MTVDGEAVGWLLVVFSFFFSASSVATNLLWPALLGMGCGLLAFVALSVEYEIDLLPPAQ